MSFFIVNVPISFLHLNLLRDATRDQPSSHKNTMFLEDFPTRYVVRFKILLFIFIYIYSVESPDVDQSLVDVKKDRLLEKSYKKCVPLR